MINIDWQSPSLAPIALDNSLVLSLLETLSPFVPVSVKVLLSFVKR